jgi:protein-S-isoprenylcysteine O-methyltransferase Ste14
MRVSPRLKVALASLVFPAVVGGIVFAAAGRLGLPFVWAILCLLAAFFLALAVFADLGLLQERVAPGAGNRDRVTRLAGIALLIAHWVMAGLDAGRLRWTPVVWPIQLTGCVAYPAALAIVFWAMKANPFYSSAVRIQSDRGQYAVAAGPYRFVRHPGYAGTLLAMAAGGVAFGSWLAMLPMLVFAALFVRRTLVEDRMLRRELPGYAEYALRVRYRLIVGVF